MKEEKKKNIEVVARDEDAKGRFLDGVFVVVQNVRKKNSLAEKRIST